MHIIGGIIGVIVGYLVIRYSVAITDNLGRIAWAEQHLRSGLAGTYSLYRIAGVVVIILSLLYMFGGIGFLVGPLSSVFGGTKPTQ
jgi:hypothetical protein